jgi:hypothetical protein
MIAITVCAVAVVAFLIGLALGWWEAKRRTEMQYDKVFAALEDSYEVQVRDRDLLIARQLAQLIKMARKQETIQ